MYKAIFIDIDGTLRDSKGQISQRTIEAIQRVTEKGILVVLCSGRPRKYTENVSKECNASRYIITSNGGNIYDYKENKDLYVNLMDKNDCIELYKMAERVEAQIIMNVGDNRVVNQVERFDGSEVELNTDIDTFVKENEIVQCVIADNDFEKIKKLGIEIKKLENVEIINQHKSLIDENAPKEGTIYYDVGNINSNKGNAIKKFCNILDINIEETAAIGDEYNDVSMLKVVGHSVAMGNAPDDVKKHADEVTTSNEEHGVAVFLEKTLHDIEKQN